MLNEFCTASSSTLWWQTGSVITGFKQYLIANKQFYFYHNIWLVTCNDIYHPHKPETNQLQKPLATNNRANWPQASCGKDHECQTCNFHNAMCRVYNKTGHITHACSSKSACESLGGVKWAATDRSWHPPSYRCVPPPWYCTPATAPQLTCTMSAVHDCDDWGGPLCEYSESEMASG